jgi:hypothetical protein
VIVAWTVVLVSLVGVQQGYAKIGVPIPAPPVSLSGGDLNFYLNRSYEAGQISPYCPFIYPQHVCTCFLNTIFTVGNLSCDKMVGARVTSLRLPG